MKFSVLALDYDGTIARDGKTHSTIVEAIREARDSGITVILVTGRILSDLRRVLDNQDLVDVIVAENGAVIQQFKWPNPVVGWPCASSIFRRAQPAQSGI